VSKGFLGWSHYTDPLLIIKKKMPLGLENRQGASKPRGPMERLHYIRWFSQMQNENIARIEEYPEGAMI
jgi:hypothetical protein